MAGWDLNHNYPNFPNHLNLCNLSLSSCINRGQGLRINIIHFQSKVMLVDFLQRPWSNRNQCPWLVEDHLFQILVVIFHHLFINKESLSSNLCLCTLMYYDLWIVFSFHCKHIVSLVFYIIYKIMQEISGSLQVLNIPYELLEQFGLKKKARINLDKQSSFFLTSLSKY